MSPGQYNGKRTYVYQILFPNNKKYIGITFDIKKRWAKHLYISQNIKCKDFSKVHKAIKKYKKDVIFSIVSICSTRKEASELEQLYINKYNTCGKGGYNVTSGGDGGWIFSNKDKNKIAKSLGQVEFIGFTIDGKQIGKWNNANQAIKDLNLKGSSSMISLIYNFKRRSAGNFYFRKTEDAHIPITNKITRKGVLLTKEEKEHIAIKCGGRQFAVYKNEELIGTFYNQVDAAKLTGSTRNNISSVLCGRRKTANGYTFKYI